MKTCVYIALLVSIVFTGTGQVCHAAQKITVGVSTGYPPYYFEENGEVTGFCVEVVNQVATTIDLNISYQAFPWKRMLANAKQGDVDAVMPLFRTIEREAYLYFDNLDIAQETNSFFTLKRRNINFSGDYESLNSYTIGVVDSYSYGEKFDNYSAFIKVPTSNEEHLIQMLVYGRFDVGVGNRSVIEYYAEKQAVAEEIRFLSPHINNELLYIGFSRVSGNGELHTKFARALKKFKKTKKYQEIVKKYSL
ncbi:substrate-binding periplasmic protein [Desulfosediminicola flagellatus]|uniref:substrate-binding periplasmic protein n=1 Tax=Desulfosediminicola flagellatus TaxID=2569541 RepID=UPI0010AB80D5|nr:transporter substrate-binding domain-containing protein [Desulfosediminicola flagellatus]